MLDPLPQLVERLPESTVGNVEQATTPRTVSAQVADPNSRLTSQASFSRDISFPSSTPALMMDNCLSGLRKLLMASATLPANKSHLSSPNRAAIYVLLVIGLILSVTVLGDISIMEWRREPDVLIKQSVSVPPSLQRNMNLSGAYVIDVSFDVSGTERVEAKNPSITLYANNASNGIHNETLITYVTFTSSPQTHTYKATFLFHPAGLVKAEKCVSLHLSGKLEITIIYYRLGFQREKTVPISFDLGQAEVCPR
jgi:hypothetical protein